MHSYFFMLLLILSSTCIRQLTYKLLTVEVKTFNHLFDGNVLVDLGIRVDYTMSHN